MCNLSEGTRINSLPIMLKEPKVNQSHFQLLYALFSYRLYQSLINHLFKLS